MGGTAVLVVEDDHVLRRELAARVAADHDLRVCGEAGSLSEAREQLGHRPELVLLDLQLSDGYALPLIGEARAQKAEVLVLTISDGERAIFAALRAGAGGYLLKREALDGVCDAIKALRDGGAPISPSIARHLLEELRPSGDEPALTGQEGRLMELFASGATYVEAARALGVSINTVREHVRKLYEKLHVSSKTEAVVRLFGPRR